ncbi:MAG: recombinase family protein [Mycoplasmatales bacterium]
MVVGYIRVSTKEQAQDKNSLVNQKHRMEQYFKQNKINNYEIIEDGGYSGTNTKRGGYQTILSLIESNLITMIVFDKLDRIGRDLIDYNTLIKLCRPRGIKIQSVTDNINLDSATGRGISNVQMSFAQMESEQTSERTIAGNKGALLQGKFPFSKYPLGLSKNKQGKLKINKDINVVKEIFKMYYEDKRTKKQIVIYLKENYGELKNWDNNKLNTILNSTLYRGYKEYQGEIYKIIKPVIKYEVDRPKQKKIPKRLINNYSYIFRDKIYYKGEKLYGSTTVKNKNKINEKHYHYYLSKDRTIKIKEDTLLEAITNAIQLKNKNLIHIKNQRLERLNELYIKENITQYQYQTYKEVIINNTAKLQVENILKINITNKGKSGIIKLGESKSVSIKI